MESLQSRVIERGLIAEADFAPTLAACRAHLADPETVFAGFTLVQTWGRVPRRTGEAQTILRRRRSQADAVDDHPAVAPVVARRR